MAERDESEESRAGSPVGRQPEQPGPKDEQRFLTLLSAISDHVYRMSPDWRDVRELGPPKLPEYQLESLGWLQEYVHPDDRPHVAVLVQQAIGAKSVFELEHRYLRPDGSPGWMLSRAAPLVDESGRILEWFGASFDITERRRVEDALRKSEARNRALFENMLDGLVYGRILYDEEGAPADFVHLAVNDAFGRVTGLDEVVGRRMTEVIPGVKERMPELVEVLARVAAGGLPERFEVEFTPLGKWLDVAAVGAEEGHVMAVFEDITERKRAGRQMESERRRLEALLDTIPVGIFIVEGPQGAISYVNRRAQELYGFESRGRTLEQNVATVMPRGLDGTLRPVATLPAYRALHGEHVRDEEMILQRPDGTTYLVAASASPLPETDGHPPGAVVVFEDVTERKRVESRLQRELETTQTLLQTADALAEWTDLQSVLQALTEAVVGVTAHTRATFALWDGAERNVRVVASTGDEPISPFTARVEEFSPQFQIVAESRETMIVDYDALPEEQRRMADAVRSHTGLLVPLVYRRGLVGGLFVDDPGTRAEFPEEEISLIEGIAAQAAVAIENARLYEAQSNIATTLQQALLQLPAEIPGIRFSHLYRSATESAAIGGDFYDLIRLQDDGYIILIGDVSGHGIEAARSATFVRDAVTVFSSEGKDAAQILNDTNEVLLRRGVSDFVSVLVAIVSPDRRHLSFCSAGHPDFILQTREGITALARGIHSPPLGVFPDWSCKLAQVALAPGDRLFLFTDGLTEARRGDELFGEERLLEWLRRVNGVALADLPSALLAEVLSFTRGALQDVAILAIEIVATG